MVHELQFKSSREFRELAKLTAKAAKPTRGVCFKLIFGGTLFQFLLSGTLRS